MNIIEPQSTFLNKSESENKFLSKENKNNMNKFHIKLNKVNTNKYMAIIAFE